MNKKMCIEEAQNWLKSMKKDVVVKDVYQYKKADGSLLYEIIRTDDKKFWTRHFSSYNGKWYFGKSPKGKPPVEQTPYRLESLDKAKVTYFVEGEKDVHSLEALGLQSTTTSFGASSYDSETGKYFKDFAEIRLIYDNDDKGIQYIKDVGNSLVNQAKKVSVVVLPYKKKKEDVTDWLNSQISPDKKALLESQKTVSFNDWLNGSDKQEIVSNGNPSIMIATEFNEHQKQLGKGYKHHRGNWYQFAEGKYVQLFDGKTFEKELITWLQVKHPNYCTRSKMNEIISNLCSYNFAGTDDTRQMPFWIDRMADKDVYMNMKNGVMNLSAYIRNDKDVFQVYNPNFFTTKQATYDYVQSGKCPKWLQYLQDVQPNENDRKILQMLAGLLLFPDTRWNVFFFIIGEAGTGKSVYLDTITALLGYDNVCSLKYFQLGDKFEVGKLTRNLANISCETESDNKRENTSAAIEENIKNITDGGLLKDEEKYQKSAFGRAIARLLFASNNMPKFADRSKGVWERLRVIHFNQKIRDSEKDNKNLRAELKEELPGIILWALEGYKLLQGEKTFPESTNGVVVKMNHTKESNHELEFMIEETVKNAGGFISSVLLYVSYKEWCYQSGYKPVGRNKFLAEFRKHYPFARESRGFENARGYSDIIIKPKGHLSTYEQWVLMMPKDYIEEDMPENYASNQ